MDTETDWYRFKVPSCHGCLFCGVYFNFRRCPISETDHLIFQGDGALGNFFWARFFFWHWFYKIFFPNITILAHNFFSYLSFPQELNDPSHMKSCSIQWTTFNGSILRKYKLGPASQLCLSVGDQRFTGVRSEKLTVMPLKKKELLIFSARVCFPFLLQAQYVFIHDALLEAITSGVTEVEAKDLGTRIRELRQVDPETGYTYLENEFCRLAKEENHPIAFKSASLNCNSAKNRYANILPCKYLTFFFPDQLCCLHFFPQVQYPLFDNFLSVTPKSSTVFKFFVGCFYIFNGQWNLFIYYKVV